MASNPWSRFFWNDYENDPGLRMCSLAAQGLWMRMLCLAAKSEPAGYLKIGNVSCTVDDLAKLAGEDNETVSRLIDELERKQVFSRTRTGTIYNRRMVEDAKLSAIRAKSGQQGGIAKHRKLATDSDLLKQNPSKTPSKTLESRVHLQKEEESGINGKSPTLENQNPTNAAARRNGGYFFAGKVIKLTQGDLDRWRELYFTIADLNARLESLDAYYDHTFSAQERKHWFPRCSKALENEHQANLKAVTAQQSFGAPGFR